MIEREPLFIVMPAFPADQLHVYPSGVGSPAGHGLMQAGIVSSFHYATPYVFFYERDAAFKRAGELTKSHNTPYFVATITLLGRYIPPPPQWEWSKPE